MLTLSVWAYSHLIYHCEAHSNAICVRLIHSYATGVRLTHLHYEHMSTLELQL